MDKLRQVKRGLMEDLLTRLVRIGGRAATDCGRFTDLEVTP
jgi:hypothetical protein